MIPTLLNKQTLQFINRKTLRYTPVAAEKDYFLTLALKILSESSLFTSLIFKGGTALHHCYLPQSRFSEDLDFTSRDKELTGEAVTAIFAPYPFFEVKKLYTSNATIKIERLKYSGILDLPNSLKFEVDRLQDVILPPKQMPYANVWGIDITYLPMPKGLCISSPLWTGLAAMSWRGNSRTHSTAILSGCAATGTPPDQTGNL